MQAAICYFALVFGAGFILGMLRVKFIVPKVGARSAELLEMPLMLIIIVIAARYIVVNFAVPVDIASRLSVGCIALILAVITELLFATIIAGQTISQYIARQDPVAGSVFIVALILYAAMPMLLSWVI